MGNFLAAKVKTRTVRVFRLVAGWLPRKRAPNGARVLVPILSLAFLRFGASGGVLAIFVGRFVFSLRRAGCGFRELKRALLAK